MYTITKGDRTMRVTQEVQLAAFLKSGWELGNSENTEPTYGVEQVEPTEEEMLEDLKSEADSLGIAYSPRIGYEALLKKVQEYKSEQGLE